MANASTPFGTILRNATTPLSNVVGIAFAAGDGELVDSWTVWDNDQWAFLIAHIGIVSNHVRSALHTFHFGDVDWVYLSFPKLDVLAQQVGDQYFVVLAAAAPMDLDSAEPALQSAVNQIRQEMFA